MFDYSKLYGKIKEVFNTQEAFADAMEMSRTAVNSRLKQNVEWKSPEIVKACELLNIPLGEAHIYFFSLISLENATQRGKSMSGADILKTLIELLEAQEQIKITYEVRNEK